MKQLDTKGAYRFIDELFDNNLIGDGTYQCAADIIQLCDKDEENDPDGEFLAELVAMSEEQLADWRREDIIDWKEDLSEEEWLDRFEIGEDKAFRSIDQLIQCTDWQFILTELLPKFVSTEEVSS